MKRTFLSRQLARPVFFASCLAIATLISSGQQAQAAGFNTCTTDSYDISNNVSGAEDCTISTEYGQDYLTTDPLTVNESPGFFGETNWEFGGKIGVDEGYLGDGSGQSGTFDFSNVDTSDWENVMLVFKDGSGTYLTGYLLLDGVDSGTWSTPFITEASDGGAYNFNGGDKDVSHISVYYTVASSSTTTAAASLTLNSAAAPEGEQVAGLGLALAAAGFLKRRFGQA